MPPQAAEPDLALLAKTWNEHVQSRPAPRWLSELVAAHPVALAKFCYSDPPDPSGPDPGDPWGREYWVEIAGGGTRQIVTSGPDELEGTEDDQWIKVANPK